MDDDDDDFSGPALGGPVNVRSDSDEDEEDEPPTMGKMLAITTNSKSSPSATGTAVTHQTFQFKNQHHLTPNPLAASPARKKPFSMEVMDF